MTIGWQDSGSCIGQSPARFVDYKEGCVAEDAILKKLCKECPVERKCLEYALANNEPGWWGGMNTRQRNRIKLKREMRGQTVGALPR